MYEKISNSGHEIVWNPEHEVEAEQAMKNTGVVSNSDLPIDEPISVSNEEAHLIQDEYEKLVEELIEGIEE